jgi:hypothetical protein
MKTLAFALFCLALASANSCNRAADKVEQARRAHFVECDTDSDCYEKYGF